jgi:hypothetical protein
LRGLAEGARIRIETTDPLAVIDIPHFCREDGHHLVSNGRNGRWPRLHHRKSLTTADGHDQRPPHSGDRERIVDQRRLVGATDPRFAREPGEQFGYETLRHDPG